MGTRKQKAATAAAPGAVDEFFQGLSADEKEAAERFIHKRRAEKLGKQLGDPFTAFMLEDRDQNRLGLFFIEAEAGRAKQALALGGTACVVERIAMYATADKWYEDMKAVFSFGELPS